MPDSLAILLPLPLSGSYDYLGDDVTPGDFVVVPLGKRETIGKVHLTTDQISANPRVKLTPPPK